MRTRAGQLVPLLALVAAGWVFGGRFGAVVALAGSLSARRHGGAAPAGAAFGLLVWAGLATAFARRPNADISLRYADGRPVAAAAAHAAGILLLVALVYFAREEAPRSEEIS